MSTAVVFVGGPHRAVPDVATRLRGVAADVVIAVDGGLGLAAELGWRVDLVVGDMDSVDPELLESARRGGARIVAHPRDKDATDLELALDEARSGGVDRAVVIAADGGRMDHLLGSALVLGSPRWASIEIDAWLGGARLVPVHRVRRVEGRPGQLVSILPVGGHAGGVRTTGLRWPLRGETLLAGHGRGISNELLDAVAHISIDDGALVVVLPEEEPR